MAAFFALSLFGVSAILQSGGAVLLSSASSAFGFVRLASGCSDAPHQHKPRLRLDLDRMGGPSAGWVRRDLGPVGFVSLSAHWGSALRHPGAGHRVRVRLRGACELGPSCALGPTSERELLTAFGAFEFVSRAFKSTTPRWAAVRVWGRPSRALGFGCTADGQLDGWVAVLLGWECGLCSCAGSWGAVKAWCCLTPAVRSRSGGCARRGLGPSWVVGAFGALGHGGRGAGAAC